MPDLDTCLKNARIVTTTVAGLQSQGVQAEIVARCVAVPSFYRTALHDPVVRRQWSGPVQFGRSD